MLQNILELLQIANGETERIRIAQDKYKLAQTFKEGVKQLKNEIKWQKKVIIDLEANTSKAQSELNDIVKELKALNQQAIKTNETLETGLKDVEKSAKDADKGFFKFQQYFKRRSYYYCFK